MMKNEAGVRIEEMLCQLADATRIDGEIWRAAYTLEDKIAKTSCVSGSRIWGLNTERTRSVTCMDGFRGQNLEPY